MFFNDGVATCSTMLGSMRIGASAAHASPTCSAVLMPSRNKTSSSAVTEALSLTIASFSWWICSAFWPAQPRRSVYRYVLRLSCERHPSELLQYLRAPALHSALGLVTSLLNSTHRLLTVSSTCLLRAVVLSALRFATWPWSSLSFHG